MRKINWGIVGLGRIAGKFVQDLRLVEGAQLHAVASRSLEKAEKFGTHYGANHFYGSYEDLLDCPDLDVVYISTPHVFHCENAMMFLKKGIGVMVEKPAGMNLTEVKKMVACAKKHNTFLMEAMWTRFFPLIQRVIDLSKDGELGELKTLRADFGFHQKYDPANRVQDKKLGGGGILDIGIYPVFLSLLLFGKPKSIFAKSRIGKSDVDDTTHIFLEFENDRAGELFCSIRELTEVEAILYGSEGKLKLHSQFHHPKKISYGKYYESETLEFHDYPGFGYQFEIEAVCKDLIAGRVENELMTHQLSIDLIEILDKIRKVAGVSYEQDSV